jgi:hypothetical protein
VGVARAVTDPVGLQQVDHEDLFVPVVEPTPPLTPGLGHALGAGPRLRRRQLREAEDRLGPRWWESEQFAELERAVEEAFAEPMLGEDPCPTGELVRPFVGHVDAPNSAHGSVWAGVGVVPPPTPVFGIAAVVDAPTDPVRVLAAPMPTRRALREQRKAQTSARTVAARRLAKGSVLAMTIFGVVASNAPQELHDRLFGGESLSAGLNPVPVTAALAGGVGIGVRHRDGVDEALRLALVKKQQVQSVSEAGQDAGGLVVAAAKAQTSVDAAAARAALDRASREAQRNPRALAKLMVADRGWSESQFVCLDKLWMRESGWRWNARNPSSGAYGLAQALPGAKMTSAGSDWQNNPATQIEWGLGYIAERYDTPCGAWGHSQRYNWY